MIQYDDMFPLWRIRERGEADPPRYYSSYSAEFVTAGTGYYSIFTNAERHKRFKGDLERNWEPFAYRIPIDDEGDS